MSGDGVPGRGARLEVTIEAMDDEGRGRAVLWPDDEEARVDVAVRGALVGDRVEAQVQRVFAARRLVHSRLTRLIHEGPMRAPRTCAHEEPCVGCPLGAMEYGAQLALKRARVEQALATAGVDVVPDDVVSAPSATGYRQKVKLVAGGRAGRLSLGLYAPYSHHVIGAERCASHRPELRDVAVELQLALNRAGVAPIQEEPLGLKAIVLRAFVEGVGAVVLSAAPLSDEAWRELEALYEQGVLVSVAERVDSAGGNSLLAGTIQRSLGAPVLTPLDGGPAASVDAFCQPDPAGAEDMYERVAAWLDDVGPGVLIDAYAGTGGFSRALVERRPDALSATNIVAVERSAACTDALHALGVRVEESDVDAALPMLRALGTPAAIVADPPRKGLFTDAEALAALGAPRFVLVSCFPDSLARDLEVLCAAGYDVERVVPIDLFPGTPEIEIVTFLVRRSP